MGRRLVRLAVLAAAVGTLAGCGSGHAAPGLTVHVDRSPFRISLLRDGKTVVAEDPDARLRYQLRSDKQYELTKVLSETGDTYRVATDEPGRTASVTVTSAATGARVDVELHPSTGVQEIFDSFDSKPSDHFLGGGELGGGDRLASPDLRGQIVSIKVGPCSYAPIPFFASSAGWGLWLRSENEAALAFPGSPGGTGCESGNESVCEFPALSDRTEVCVRGASLGETLYAGTIPRALADYEADAGEPAVPPPSELALIKWRDVSAGPGDLLDDIDRLQGAGIPIGWELLDNPWEPGGCNGLLTFDSAQFPDPAGMIREIHAHGVKFMLWISPRETCPDGYPPGSLIGAPGDGKILDLRDHAAVAEFQKRLRRLVAMGVDGFKGDRGDENDLEKISPSLDNEYPLLYAKAAIATLPKGGAAIFRAATVGSQAVLPGIWAGDQDQGWDGLEQAVMAGETAGMSGFPTWGSDVGGYAGPPVTADVFERWAQLGAVSPVFEVGGRSGNATPWTLGPEAMEVLKDSAILHYELFPYLYGLLQQHEPVLRPLGYGYPDDPGSWASPGIVLVGPDLVAAPVTGQGTTPSVYLPPGSWVDLYTGAIVQGGGPSFTRATPMTQFPLYAKLGSVLPFDLRTQTGSWWGTNELTHPGRAGFMATNGATLSLRDEPREVQIFVPIGEKPTRVTIAGRPVSWSWNAGPLPGIVVRVHGPALHGRILAS